MNKKIQDMIDKYPNLFLDKGPRSGFYIGDGWLTLLDNLFNIIITHKHDLDVADAKQIYINQVKEKFGSIRVYLNKSTDYINGAISLAELMSSHICEFCGSPGKTQKGNWVKTLCESCNTKRNGS